VSTIYFFAAFFGKAFCLQKSTIYFFAAFFGKAFCLQKGLR
jgi:hypothetical protein